MINRAKFAIAVLAAFPCAVPFAIAQQCDVKAAPTAARTFAKTSDKAAWHEYPKVGDIPPIDLEGSESARILQDKDGRSSVDTVQPGEDFWIYSRYCFDSSGLLVQISLKVRTAWNWGYRLDGSVSEGKLRPRLSEFFSTKDGRPIPRPSQADDIPDALQPTLYRNIHDLPFASALAESQNPKQVLPTTVD